MGQEDEEDNDTSLANRFSWLASDEVFINDIM